MNKISKFLLILILLPVFQLSAVEKWKNDQLSFEERTADLVAKLTLEEKVQLMRYDSPGISRLGIKSYNWWNECLHGVARTGKATVFPQAIAMAAMWDPNQMYRIANAISDEARAKYTDYQFQGKYNIYQGLTYWTPNINIFRDPRWGRGMETYGEDPFLTAEVAIPFIKGLQGNDSKYFKLIATVKHFAVHSGPEGLRHSFDVWPSDYDLAETYLPHFERTIKEAKAYSVMCAYQRLKGAPCCGSQFLENILRNEWNFKGYIVSDCGAVKDFYEKNAHHVVATPEEAAAMAVKAGTDLNCGPVYAGSLFKAVKQGLVSENEINLSVSRLILARMKLGEFDTQVKYSKIPLSVVDGAAHEQIALEAARKSMVLLQNSILPYSKKVRKVAVIGPNADNQEMLLANYNGYSTHMVTPLQGVKNKLPNAEVHYALGCRLADELPYLEPIPADFLYASDELNSKGLNASYYQTKGCKGEPIINRTDKNVDFTWWNGSPSVEIKPDSFSACWTGVLVPPVSGKYALGGEAANGFNLYLNDSLYLHGRKSEHHSRMEYEYVQLEAGKPYKIRFELLENNQEYALAKLLWDMPKPDLLADAVKLASESDLIVLCLGLSPSLEGEEMKVKVPGFNMGDREDIQLPESQRKLITEIQKLNKPSALVLMNGSAVSLSDDALKLPAILEAWYPGEAGGTAVADILFGDYNPSGRLPLTFYKSIDQIPAFDEYDMKGKTYKYFEGEAQFEFGYGLSFTNYTYSIKNQPTQAKTNQKLEIEAEVKNSGKFDGEEVVQLYISLPESNLQKPLRSLQGFKRVFLKAGETKTVKFELTPSQMAARNAQNALVCQSGKVLISIGGKQPDAKSIQVKNVVQTSVMLTGSDYYPN